MKIFSLSTDVIAVVGAAFGIANNKIYAVHSMAACKKKKK